MDRETTQSWKPALPPGAAHPLLRVVVEEPPGRARDAGPAFPERRHVRLHLRAGGAEGKIL